MLFLNSLSHMLVDALCVSTLFGTIADKSCLPEMLVIYNTLAFSTQCIVGIAADRFGKHAIAAAGSMAAVILGFLLPVPAILKVCMIGLGNSVFHVAGGTMTLLESDGKAGKLGIFVAPGCIGLTFGTLYPQYGYILAAAAAVCAAAIAVTGCRQSADLAKPIYAENREDKSSMFIPLLLTAAVAVRAIGGCAASFSWKTTAPLTMLMTAFIFFGKTLGGILSDRLGCAKVAVISISAAAVLTAFCSEFMLPSLIGQFALNLTMPVTLWLLYKALPDAPGFAFGLAASALWPGTIIGQFINLTGPAAWICIILSFVFGLWAIIFAIRKLPEVPRFDHEIRADITLENEGETI